MLRFGTRPLSGAYIHIEPKHLTYIMDNPDPASCCVLTIGELGVRQLQVFAGPGRVVLGADGVLQPLDVLLEIIERAEDVLHALAVVQPGLVGLHLAGAPGLLRGPDRQRLDDLTRGTLRNRDKPDVNRLSLYTHC